MICQVNYTNHPVFELANREFLRLQEFMGVKFSGTVLATASPVDYSVDGYIIDVDFASGQGTITGSNPRSVLFAVYRLMTELGFRWIRPGEKGEIVPEKPDVMPHIKLTDKADSRYRGICIEGAVSKENVLDMIHWITKLGFNSYFIQFRDAYTFFDRWYTHEHNPMLEAADFSYEKAAEITLELRKEIRNLDLDLHMVGHGWTCEPFGIHAGEWHEYKGEISEETRQYFAEINEKRELFNGLALNTNLCYSKPEVRHRIATAIAEYAGKNQDINILHFWLADGVNNQCECSDCAVKRPADWYIDMLNETDAALTAAGLDTKIVFLIYVDLLWPPEKEKLINPDRFILMFAPITRSYDYPFKPDSVADADSLPAFDRNHLVMPKDPAQNLAFLGQWRNTFSGDGFDFDYHYMWDHDKDPGYYNMAKILHQDCRNLKDIGLNGLISCQASRVFFPHALGMTVMGRTLWNRDLTFEEIEEDFFVSAYGKKGASAARDYFKSISEIFHPTVLRTGGSREERDALLAALPKYRDAIKQVAPALQEGMKSADPAQRESWEQMALHHEMLGFLSEYICAALSDNNAAEKLEALFNWARSNEMRLQNVFDLFEYVTVFNDQVNPKLTKKEE